ncbi:bifunctional phosphoribosylaminoimidazolecarboxamide formyltransferase/IMP cyclohydrolase [Candidatus Gracilibacteria bacterium]|nr:bifunctional phosphoribosylaminoimidazolecarboxamide formyltransferase/IMP cyclohydrolase [Candidatus Gracilibacteria bacterium]
MIKTALISVTDKSGIVDFAAALAKKNIRILSTGGTAKILREAGISVEDVSEHTGFPEVMGGRVKTLHPKVFGGILMRRENAGDIEVAAKEGITPIDLVCVNLYEFEKSAAQEGLSEDDTIEQIDIGGPSLIRAAAKNYKYVTVVTRTEQYDEVIKEIAANGETSPETRKKLAFEAFEGTSNYDTHIYKWFRGKLDMPELLDLNYEKVRTLRYGENPHQRAAFFRNKKNHDANVTNAKVLHGKELSFNNIVDANSALELVKEFEKPAVAIIKHNNPCGVAVSTSIENAFDRAFHVDTLSAFGSVIALNRPVTLAIAEYIKKHKIFVELIVCPSFDADALALLEEKVNIRLLETGPLKLDEEKRDIKKVAGGLLVQNANTYIVSESDLKVVTKKQPTKEEIHAMLFANIICKHVMSNAVIFAKSNGESDWATGIGAGQMSRVDSVTIAVKKGGENIPGSVMASDAFFPFPDAVEQAAAAGVTSIISPGGSIRDQEVIDVADKLGISMVFTGYRMFRH